MRLFQKLFRSLRRQSPRSRPFPKTRRLELVGLEDRVVPTTTLFLDFGTAFPSGGLQMTVRQLRDTLSGPDLTAVGLANNDTLTFNSLRSVVNFDFNGDGTANASDASALQAAVVSLVGRYYAPFDVEVQSAAAGSLNDVTNTLAANGNDASGHNDAYVFVTPVTNSGLAIPSGLFGIAALPDIGVGNLHDDSAVVFANNIFAFSGDATADTALAYTTAHEAAHNFGLEHTVNSPSTSDAGILARSDVISQFSTAVGRSNYEFFTRFPLALVGGGTQNSYDLLVNDGDIGPASGPAYVTGTGAHDVITLTRLDATHATVTVQAFRLPTYAAADQIGATFSYTIDTSDGVTVEAGFGDDRIVVDATLGTFVDVYGMAGTDHLVLMGDGVTSATYQPGSYTVAGKDGAEAFHGFVNAGATSIYYEEFEPTGSVTVQNVPSLTLYAALNLDDNGTDTLTVTRPAASQNQVSGDTAGVSMVPLTTVSVGRLTIDAGLNDGSAGSADRITVRGAGSPVTVNAGIGNDTLVVDIASGMPLSSGSLTYDGGTGSNSLVLQGTSGYNSETYTPTGPAAGSIDLRAAFTIVFPGTPPVIAYSNVQQITDTMTLSTFFLDPFHPIAPSVAFNGTSGANVVSVTNGTAIGGLTTLLVSSPLSFAPVTLANKPVVSVNGLGGVDTITLNYATAAAGLTTVRVDGGAQGDTVNVQRVSTNVPVTVNGGDGDDTVNLGNNTGTSPFGLDAVRSPVTVNGQNGANDIVNLLDQTAGFSDAYTITDTTVGRPFFGAASATPATPGLTYGTIENLVLQAETGNNTITVSNLAAATAVTIQGNGGTDTLIGPNFVNTWGLNASGTHTLDARLSATATGRVSFSGVENLTGGSANDAFQFGAGAAVSGRIDGGGGENTLDYLLYVSPPAPGYGGPGVSVTLADAPAVGAATGTGGVLNIQNVYGSRGNDTIAGNAAANTLASYGGVDVISGGGSNDNIYIYGQQYTGSSIDGGTGNDTLYATNRANTWDLTGLNIGSVSDAFGVYTYNNVENLTGGSGSDVFRFLNAASGISGTLRGDGGVDSLDYSLFPGAVTVNLETGSATGVSGGAASRVLTMENVLGARNFANTLTGASTPSAGNPAVNSLGNALSSVMVGGTVADVLTAGGGNSILIGGGGADQLVANAGTPGFDILIGCTTDYDSNLDVLNAFAAAWRNTIAANYAAQVALLRDTGVGANGAIYRLNNAAVHNDSAVDTMIGATNAQPALDWFFVNPNDVVQNLKAPEVQTLIP